MKTPKVYGSRSVAGSADVTSAQVVPPNAARTRITFYPHATLAYSVGFGEPAVASKGVTVNPLGHPATLTYDDLGEQIHANITAISTAPCAFGILETSGECPCAE